MTRKGSPSITIIATEVAMWQLHSYCMHMLLMGQTPWQQDPTRAFMAASGNPWDGISQAGRLLLTTSVWLRRRRRRLKRPQRLGQLLGLLLCPVPLEAVSAWDSFYAQYPWKK